MTTAFVGAQVAAPPGERHAKRDRLSLWGSGPHTHHHHPSPVLLASSSFSSNSSISASPPQLSRSPSSCTPHQPASQPLPPPHPVLHLPQAQPPPHLHVRLMSFHPSCTLASTICLLPHALKSARVAGGRRAGGRRARNRVAGNGVGVVGGWKETEAHKKLMADGSQESGAHSLTQLSQRNFYGTRRSRLGRLSALEFTNPSARIANRSCARIEMYRRTTTEGRDRDAANADSENCAEVAREEKHKMGKPGSDPTTTNSHVGSPSLDSSQPDRRDGDSNQISRSTRRHPKCVKAWGASWDDVQAKCPMHVAKALT